MRTKLILLVLVLTCVFAVAAPAFAQDQPVASVNTAYLNIRSGPGLNYGAIATLPQGFGVRLLGRNSGENWVLVGLTDGTQGWANINYLYTTASVHSLPVAETTQGSPIAGSPITPSATITGFVVAGLLSGPNENNPVVGNAPYGATVSLLGRSYNSEWVLVRLANGTQGWIPSTAVTGNVPVRALSPADGSVWAPPPPSNTPGGSTGGYQTYTIAPGDTLFSIAQQFGVDVWALASLNHIYNINLIYWGTVLYIPS
ncbi:MAG: SH3 domain-containing protein [Anaerolineae bacterium]